MIPAVRHCPVSSNTLDFSETTGSVEVQFHVEPPWMGEQKFT